MFLLKIGLRLGSAVSHFVEGGPKQIGTDSASNHPRTCNTHTQIGTRFVIDEQNYDCASFWLPDQRHQQAGQQYLEHTCI